MVLDLGSLLISIWNGLQTDTITQSHLTCLGVSPDSTTTIPATASPSDPWSLSQDSNLLHYKGLLYVPTIRMSDWISFTHTMTITLLDTQALPRLSRTSVVSFIGPK